MHALTVPQVSLWRLPQFNADFSLIAPAQSSVSYDIALSAGQFAIPYAASHVSQLPCNSLLSLANAAPAAMLVMLRLFCSFGSSFLWVDTFLGRLG